MPNIFFHMPSTAVILLRQYQSIQCAAFRVWSLDEPELEQRRTWDPLPSDGVLTNLILSFTLDLPILQLKNERWKGMPCGVLMIPTGDKDRDRDSRVLYIVVLFSDSRLALSKKIEEKERDHNHKKSITDGKCCLNRKITTFKP